MKHNTNTHEAVVALTNEDFKTSIVIVSVIINAFVLTAWIAAQVSSEYASQLASLI